MTSTKNNSGSKVGYDPWYRFTLLIYMYKENNVMDEKREIFNVLI